MAIPRSWMMRNLLSLLPNLKPTRPKSFLFLDRSLPIEEETTPDYNPKNVLPVDLGVLLNGRYRVAGKLGHGRACTIWLAKDTQKWSWQSHRYVALKVNNNTVNAWKHAEHEIAISKCLATKNKSHRGFRYIRTVLDSFPIAGPHGIHLCLAFEPLREPLWLFQQRSVDGRYSSDAVKAIMRYMLKGLEYLHSECGVIHTDIKPGNILLEFEDQTYGATSSRAKGQLIQLNEYRAPEVILGAGWTYSVDIWNLGVMLWDLLENEPLFPYVMYKGEAHIAQMISLFGPAPSGLVSRGESASQYFDVHGDFEFPQLINSDMRLEDTLPSLQGEDKELFLDFVRSMLRWDPFERASPTELLLHPWFQGHGYVIRGKKRRETL